MYNTNEKSLEAFTHRFVEVDTLLDVLKEYRYAALSHKSERDALRAILLRFRGEKVVGTRMRFPELYHLDVTAPPVGEITASLMHALNCSERSSNDNHHYDVSYLTARKCLSNLLGILRSTGPSKALHNIYYRESLEQRYNLVWTLCCREQSVWWRTSLPFARRTSVVPGSSIRPEVVLERRHAH